ncbi:hypothetical protein [Fimbriiglobus ruber]|uniref:Beta-galactosidase n=1 Tax=Fimbriiglobus ruber TaxID=1908690 RepID=A0A225DI45_9BACT|nr:hypothetical protein [Fimbriiglobus ruber]OWK41112.1 Beta-galactosidase [Fimbriiglobus ruber]
MPIAALVVSLGCLLTAPRMPDEVVWIEGETPTRATAPLEPGGWGRPGTLADGKWLFAAVDAGEVAKKVPATGANAAYDFRAPAGGKYDVWARVGYEFARSPFRWRTDAGEWQTVTPNDLTTDLMVMSDWAEVAWRKLGTADLTAGAHVLEFNVPRPTKTVNGKAEPERFLFGLDCVCLARGAFVPNGPHKPGADWKTAIDREADGAAFEFPGATGAGDAPPARRTLSLGGVWQIARFDENDITDRTGPISALPDLDKLYWHGIRVPGDKDANRPDLAYCHRYLYRTKVSVPREFAGRSFVLRFPNNALLTTVFVNGKQVGFSNTPCANFECDATAAVVPGMVNEIVVGIKDLYYAVAKTGEGKSCRYLFNLPHQMFHNSGGLGATRFADFPVLYQVRRNGILETPSLVVGGSVYTADAFAIPSVAEMKLGLEITVHNPTTKPAEVVVKNEIREITADGVPAAGPTVFGLQPKTVTVKPNQPEVLTLGQRWTDAKFWWPDSPHQYALVTTIHIDGKAVDELVTKFGFREWGVRGRSFTLNGVPWALRADLRHNERQPTVKAAEDAVKEWHKNGQNMVRFWGEQPWVGATQRESLDFFDAAGVPVRRSGIFDGQVASYQLVNDGKANAALFDNWRAQLAAWVKAERNHPSVFVWSLENEITYINARNLGWLKQVEPEIQKAADLVMKLDPTRKAMIDGGDALMGQTLPVAGNHYLESDKRDYPDEAYTLAKGFSRHTGARPGDPWPLPKDKPLFLGESYFANGSPPAAYAEIEGESAFLGRKEAARGVARFARMLSEGYRWNGVAAFHFWFAEGPDAEHYRAWQPVAVLCREWDTAFAAGTKVPRTLKLFNDTRTTAPITVHWLFQTKNTNPVKQVRGKKELRLAPGGSEEFAIEMAIPDLPAGQAVAGEFVLTCVRGGREVFRDVKACRILGAVVPLDKSAGDEIALLDPTGKGARLLRGLGTFTSIKTIDELPAKCRVLVVGPDAVTPAAATDPRWKGLAAKGVRVLVLDQTTPLHYQAVPADLEPTDFTGRIGFPENPRHPAFAGLSREDFFCWSNGHIVYRNAYRKPTRGGRSLVQCDAELSCTALVEVPVADGLLLLSQLAVGDRPDDPVARRVVANLLRYAIAYQRAARPTAVLLPDNDPRLQLLTASGLKYKRADDPVVALGEAEVVIADATPDALAKLAAAADKVKAFTNTGGALVLWGVTPAGLGDFNKLVGFDHVIRPFKMERVTLPPVRDPLLAGLTIRDMALESAEKIYPWSGDRYPANDTFTYVVDTDDIAPFVKSEKYAHGWSQMTNGLTSADSWKFIFYHDQSKAGERPSWRGTLPKEEEITGLSVIINAHYRKLTRLRVVFDDNVATAVTLALKPEGELKQSFTFPPRKCRSIALEPLEWTDHTHPVIGIDNLWLTVRRPPDFASRVVPLLNIGALVHYPQGKGGILLNQVNVPAAEPNPENAGKKRNLVATLLRNLGADFAVERVVIPGQNLVYTPIPLGEKCNTFLTADKGWLPGQPDLAHFPVGDQQFAGVRYAVRDFKTSPLPAVIALTGPGAKAGTPAEVKGIPVNQKADALFFLHTFHQAKEWKPTGAAEPPVVVRYTVHFDDGQTAEIPVRLNRRIGPWLLAAPKPLQDAVVAWAAPFPAGKGPGDKQAVVYQTQWTNLRPDHAIVAVDASVPEGEQYGVPVLFGITAATERK